MLTYFAVEGEPASKSNRPSESARTVPRIDRIEPIEPEHPRRPDETDPLTMPCVPFSDETLLSRKLANMKQLTRFQFTDAAAKAEPVVISVVSDILAALGTELALDRSSFMHRFFGALSNFQIELPGVAQLEFLPVDHVLSQALARVAEVQYGERPTLQDIEQLIRDAQSAHYVVLMAQAQKRLKLSWSVESLLCEMPVCLTAMLFYCFHIDLNSSNALF